jgi:hypothetical protein
MQVPSYERHKNAQQAVFLLFANNNCFPTLDEKLVALFEFRRFLWNQRGGGGGATLACDVLYRKFFIKGSPIFKAASPMIAMPLK